MPLPPRREPRVLAVLRTPTGFAVAVADPSELRSVFSITCRDLTLGPGIARAMRREKPTLVLAPEEPVRAAVLRAAHRLGIPVAEGVLPKVPSFIAADLYPEIHLRATSPMLLQVATLAISAVLYAETPSRRYATTRRRPPERPA
jgi:hypothetical protein